MATDDRARDDADADRATDVPSARASLIRAIEGAGFETSDEGVEEAPDLVKVGGGGLSIELRLNGSTIPLDGQDVNELAADDFQPFIARQKDAIEAGDLDDAIEAALANDGLGKALARVRALD